MPRGSPGPCLGPLSRQLAGSRAAPCESQAGPRALLGLQGEGPGEMGVGGREVPTGNPWGRSPPTPPPTFKAAAPVLLR